jgi:hypothetical protein
MRYRHGISSRNQVVREAIGWLRAKEAAWLIRARRQEERRRRDAEELEAGLNVPREQREHQEVEAVVRDALAVARGDTET